jgi:hypothetical protein
MKNIHLLPTDKSRLYIHQGKLYDNKKTMHIPDGVQIPHHIYITEDSEIKEGDWIIWNKKIVKAIDTAYYSAKKIILTTDRDLIADGVQSIDDTFLEWFVKNPSCEKVETERLENGKYVDWLADGSVIEGIYENYKIIIPQETIEEAADLWATDTKNVHPADSYIAKQSFIQGAKSQQEQDKNKYSEEEVIELLHSRMRYTLGEDYKEMTTIDWFEQYKKK